MAAIAELTLEWVQQRFAELVPKAPTVVVKPSKANVAGADGLVRVGTRDFIVELKQQGELATVARAVAQLRAHAKALASYATPLLVVPFMTEDGQKRCAEAGVSWLDLSGNADVTAPGLRVLVEGKQNRFKRPGRVRTAFAPKGARIARWLLTHPKVSPSQAELAAATGLNPGHVSKVVSKLESDGLVARTRDGGLQVLSPDLLLDTWRAQYDFSKHEIVKGGFAARDGVERTRRFADALERQSLRHAVTGLAGAWLVDRFAAFRTATFYLQKPLTAEQLEKLGFHAEERGANVWLVVPNDSGVFQGAGQRDGLRTVHPIQMYLDLGAHHERAREAADHLREHHLNWRTDD